MQTSKAENTVEMSVAMATPATPRLQMITKNRFKSTLMIPEIVKVAKGRPLSPFARSMAEPKS